MEIVLKRIAKQNTYIHHRAYVYPEGRGGGAQGELYAQ